jgi:hypothetical protein
MKHFTCAILAASTILTGSLSSVLADDISGEPTINPTSGDTGIVQTNVQTTIFTGDENESNQINRQESTMRRGHSSSGDDVVVQESDQYCDALGNRNICTQDSGQRSRINRR